MDTIATIIVTAFANIIITGVVSHLIFSRFQKNIELSFSKKLEDYKAQLQLSNFEQQTKFTRNYEKRVEALEHLYKKLAIYKSKIRHIAMETALYYPWEKNSINITKEDFRECISMLDEFSSILEENTFLLPAHLVFEIRGIAGRLWILQNYFPYLLPFWGFTHSPSFLNQRAKGFHFKISPLDAEKPDFAFFIHQIAAEIDNEIRKLEDIYKSVADTKQT